MQKSGFFNALRIDGDYDRKYNANDYSDNLAVVIGNGVLRSVDDDLRVTASGMTVTVGIGRAWINGHYYYNDTPLTFSTVTAPAGGTRYDRVFLRCNTDISVRSIELVYRQGTAANTPTKPAPVREGNIYELVLADVFVGTNATSVTVTDTRSDESICGWVFSTRGNEAFFKTLDNEFNAWFDRTRDEVATVTIFKQYVWRTTLSAAASQVPFNIPQYDANGVNIIEVYVNGLLRNNPAHYTVSGSVITFKGSLVAGTEVIVVVHKSIDGNGIDSVADEITKLQNDVANIAGANEYTYICNGVNDNVRISDIVQGWLNGGTDYSSYKLNVYGTFGATTPYGGSGTSTSPYRWMSLGGGTVTNRRVVVDFSACSQMTFNCTADTYNVILYGMQVNVIGANITIFSTSGTTQANATNCRFWVTANTGYIARGGVFRDCRASLTINNGNAYCFNVMSSGLLRVYGGEYYAYATASYFSTVVYVNSGQTGAVVNTYSMSCPTNARGGYVQSYSINCNTNDACCSFTDTITTLPITAAGQSIRGTIAKSKAGLI